MVGVRSDSPHVNGFQAMPALVAVSVLASIYTAGCLHGAPTRAHVVAMLPVAMAWGLLVSWLCPRLPAMSTGIVLATAMAVRAPLVGTPPLLSDDLWRYLFEGSAMLSGNNPFVSSPSELSHLAPEWADKVNHPELTSIYPPAALLWFQVLAYLGSSTAAQGATALADSATAALLAHSSNRRGIGSWPGIAWALHPLPVIESASNAHLEPLACLALVLALSQSERMQGAWLALAAGVKLLPLLLFPTWLRSQPSRNNWQGAMAVLALLVAVSLPVLGAGPGLFDSLGTYASHWSFNSLGMTVLQPIAGTYTRPMLLAIGALGTMAVVAWRRDLPTVALGVGTLFLCTSPTAHPWYALWVLAPSLWLGHRAWLYGATGLLASYAVLFTWDPVSGGWTEPWWLWIISWGWILVAWPWEALSGRAARAD